MKKQCSGHRKAVLSQIPLLKALLCVNILIILLREQRKNAVGFVSQVTVLDILRHSEHHYGVWEVRKGIWGKKLL